MCLLISNPQKEERIGGSPDNLINLNRVNYLASKKMLFLIPLSFSVFIRLT